MPDCQTTTSCVKRHRTRCIIIRVVAAFDCEKNIRTQTERSAGPGCMIGTLNLSILNIITV